MGIAAQTLPFHVLAVDDSQFDRKLIERLLKISCYQVTVVDSVSKALEFLGLYEVEERENDPDFVQVNLIITDYCMPEMTGYDLLRKIKGSESLKDIPVVIMSSENVPSRINRCMEDGADDFLMKPVQLSDVKKLKPHPHVLKEKVLEAELNSNKRKSNGEEIDDSASPGRTTRCRCNELDLEL